MFIGIFTYVKQLGKILISLSLLVNIAYAQQVQSFVREQLDFVITTTSTRVLDLDLKRRFLIIQNKGNYPVFISYDVAGSGDNGTEIASGGNFEPRLAFTNAIWLKTLTGTAKVVVTYGRE